MARRPSLPRYVKAIPRRGRIYYYFRFRDIYQRLPDDPESAAFHARYAEILAGLEPKGGPQRIVPDSLAAMVRDYLASPEFQRLRAKSRDYYRRQLDRISIIGEHPAAAIRRRHILALRDQIGAGRTADQFIQVVRRLFSWGLDRELVSENPAMRIARTHTSQRYTAWSDEALAEFEAITPIGPIRTAYMLGRYTGQRRGDVLAMTKADYDGAWIRVEAQEKTGEPLWIPAHPALRAYLDQLGIEVGLLVKGPGAGPWDRSGFAKAFRRALDVAGLRALHFHGLRHSASRSLAEAGCTDEEIAAITGHRAREMVAHYTRQARQRRLAEAAINKLVDHEKRTGTERESGKLPAGFTTPPNSRSAKPLKRWSEWGDSNSRPPAPEAGALPGCATLRKPYGLFRRLRRRNGEHPRWRLRAL